MALRANHFWRRLESQRHEFLLGAQHSTSKALAESSFPGSNPFHHTQQPGMQRLEEEDEMDTFASPTASSFPNTAMNRDASPFGNQDPFAANSNPFGGASNNNAAASGSPFAQSQASDPSAQPSSSESAA